MEHLTTGQLAQRARVNIETIRYYERRGLIPEPPRRLSGYRQYSHEDVTRVRFIKRAQELGFSLDEIAELLALRVAPDATCEDVKKQTIAKIADISAKMKTLETMRQVLTNLVEACNTRAPTSACPILEALDAEEPDDADR